MHNKFLFDIGPYLLQFKFKKATCPQDEVSVCISWNCLTVLLSVLIISYLLKLFSSFDIYLKCSLRFLSFHFFPVCKLNFVSNFITIYYGFEMPDSQDNVLDFSVCMTVPLSDCTFIFLPFSTSSETSRLFSYLNVFRFRSHFRFYLLTP